MIVFHPGAESSFTAAAQELLQGVRAYPPSEKLKGANFPIHPAAVIEQRDIIGTIRVTDRMVDFTGSEIGRFWNLDGQRFGWAGEEFQKLKRLAERIAKSIEPQALVSEAFILDQVFAWLCESLEGKRSDPIADFVAVRCDEAIEDHEIYVPLCRTYSSAGFEIGDVQFRSISKQLLDGWFPSKPLGDPEMEQRVRILENQTRASYQATLAACVKVRAEKAAASQFALERAVTASAFLRFLSTANWTSKMRSFAMPFGMENGAAWHSFRLKDGVIRELSSAVIWEGPPDWVIDDARGRLPGLLEAISDLAKIQNTEFRKSLLEAMLIYSRNSLTTDPANKLVFILVALESVLLKNANEPILGNLAERMAFLIGASLEDRKKIVSLVKKTYAQRLSLSITGKPSMTLNRSTVSCSPLGPLSRSCSNCATTSRLG